MQQLVQALAGLGRGLFQHPLDHPRRHIFQQVGGVVQTHLLDGGDQLDVGELIHQLVPRLVRHIGKDLGGHFLFQQPEHHQPVVFVQFFQQFGQVGGLHILGDFPQLDVLFFDQQLEQPALGQFVGGGRRFPRLFLFCVPHVLFQVLGGFLVVQVAGQLFPHLGGDIGGQFLHGHLFLMLVQSARRLPAESVLLLFFHGSIPPQLLVSQEGTVHRKTKKAQPAAGACPAPARKAALFTAARPHGNRGYPQVPLAQSTNGGPASCRGAAFFSFIQPPGR